MKRPQDNESFRVGQVKIEFTDKPITAWGGIASLIAKYLERIGFREWVESHLPIEEKSNNGRGKYEKVLAQFLTVLVGGERFSHLSWWGHGVEAIQATFGLKWLPRAISTLTRFWGKINTQSLSNQLSDAARTLAVKLLMWENIAEDNLNLDSTVLTRYGQQQGAKRGYNPKKHGRPSHNPLLAFLGTGYVINLWNRSGDTFSGHRAVEFFDQTIGSLGEDFRVKRVLCDSGFYLVDFIDYLESKGYSYVIVARQIPVLQRQVYGIKQWRSVDEGIDVGEFYFEHLDAKWKQLRRYVVVRQEINRRPKATGKQLIIFEQIEGVKDYRFSLMITNDNDSPAEEVWREYRPRANDENLIKDLKEGYGLAAFSMDNFWATEAVMVINALVFHNLIHYLNRNILSEGKRPLHQMKTLRFKFLILPAQLGSSGGYSVLRLAVGGIKMREKLIYFLRRIKNIVPDLNCNAVRVTEASH